MTIYKDLLHGDEIFNDAYPLKEYDEYTYEISIGRKEDEDGSLTYDLPYDHKLSERICEGQEYRHLLQQYMTKFLDLMEKKGTSKDEMARLKESSTWFSRLLVKNHMGTYTLMVHAPARVEELEDGNAMPVAIFDRVDGGPYAAIWKDGVKGEGAPSKK